MRNPPPPPPHVSVVLIVTFRVVKYDSHVDARYMRYVVVVVVVDAVVAP
jgi:hypothetical protein